MTRRKNPNVTQRIRIDERVKMDLSTAMQSTLTRSQAILLLGGEPPTLAQAARRIGITAQAIDQWPEVLTARQRDRVFAAMWREHARFIFATYGHPARRSADRTEETATSGRE